MKQHCEYKRISANEFRRENSGFESWTVSRVWKCRNEGNGQWNILEKSRLCARGDMWSRLTLGCLGAWGHTKARTELYQWHHVSLLALAKHLEVVSDVFHSSVSSASHVWSKSTFWHSTSPTYQESVHCSDSLSPILVQLTIISHLNLTSAFNWALGFLPCLGSISCLQSSQTTPVKLNITVVCFLA